MKPSMLATTRRRFLRGTGVCLALPWMESLLPRRALGATGPELGVTPDGTPLRTAFIYLPNGAQQDHWFPTGEGREFEFGPTMRPLQNVKSSVQVITGLDQENAEAGPDGAGDHARANATFLTGTRARKTSGADIHLGESIDQVAARHIGEQTRFSSLELSCDSVRKSGRCDSGYSCAYQFNISWRSPTSPMTPEPNPRLVFERLFGSNDAETEKNRVLREQERRSLLDFITDDARSLQRELGTEDRRKLDEYLTGVRELESRIERAKKFPMPPRPEFAVPDGIPEDYGQHIDLMYDLMLLAFQTDSTRIATFMLAHDGSNRPFPQIGVSEGHHSLTHEQEQEEVCQKIAKIDLWYMQKFARFLERLDNTPDAHGKSLLYNSMIVYGSGIADANRHSHDNLPFVLAGHGGGTLDAGRYVQADSVPMSNAFLSLLDRLGIEGEERFGDSTGRWDGM
jgi:hypothetical protein